MPLTLQDPRSTLEYEPKSATLRNRFSLLTLMPLWCGVLVALGLARRWMPWKSDDPFWLAAILLAVAGAIASGVRGRHGDMMICVATFVVVILVSVFLPSLSLP